MAATMIQQHRQCIEWSASMAAAMKTEKRERRREAPPPPPPTTTSSVRRRLGRRRSPPRAPRHLSRIGLLSCLALSSFPRRSSAGPAPRHAPLAGLSQPDGAVLDQLYGRGNHEFAYLVDAGGYPVVRDGAGWYVYAVDDVGESSPYGSSKKSSGVRGRRRTMRVGVVDPAKAGLVRGDSTDLAEWVEREKSSRRRLADGGGGEDDEWDAAGELTPVLAEKVRSERQRRAQQQGTTTETLNNLVVPLVFSDHKDRLDDGELPPLLDLDTYMNSDVIDEALSPTGSIRSVYNEFSYGRLDLVSYVVPRWIVVSQTESYSSGGVSGFTSKSAHALKEALDIIENDGGLLSGLAPGVGDRVEDFDSVTFLHSGRAAEFFGKDCRDAEREDRLWAHSRSISRTSPVTGNTNSVLYTLASSLWGTGGKDCREKDIARVGMLCHEIGHTLPLPDLYGSSGQEGIGVGYYDTMAYVWGADNSQRYPAHFSAWSKIQMGWVEPTVVTEDGLYSVGALASQDATEPRVYKIQSGYKSKEYLLIENRFPMNLDAEIRGEGGVIVYHVDDKASDMSKNGYPGHVDSKGVEWPSCGRHYFLAVLQADGEYDLEKGTNIGDAGDLYVRGKELRSGSDENDPTAGPHPNTDSYQRGVIRQTGVRLHDFGESGEVMTFRVQLDADGTETIGAPTDAPTPTPAPTTTPTAPPSRKPTPEPADVPSKPPTRSPTSSPSQTPTVPPTATPTRSPTRAPTLKPTGLPTRQPTRDRTPSPTASPSDRPTPQPTEAPTMRPSERPSAPPTATPSFSPSVAPSHLPTAAPSLDPTALPSSSPTLSASPSAVPSGVPSAVPTISEAPTLSTPPSSAPSNRPSSHPSSEPSRTPTESFSPSANPSSVPTTSPTASAPPSARPSNTPTTEPSAKPSSSPTTSAAPSAQPSAVPTSDPSFLPSAAPSFDPTVSVSPTVSVRPSAAPTDSPSVTPSDTASLRPSTAPSDSPSVLPSDSSSASPSARLSSHPSALPSAPPTSTSAPASSEFVPALPGASPINSTAEAEGASQGATNVLPEEEEPAATESDPQAPTLTGDTTINVEYEDNTIVDLQHAMFQLFLQTQQVGEEEPSDDKNETSSDVEDEESVAEQDAGVSALTAATGTPITSSQDAEMQKLKPNIFLLGT